MARLRNLSTTLLKPFQSPDSTHTRSVSTPLSLQISDQVSQEPQPPSPARDSAATSPTQPTHAPSVRRDRAFSSRPSSMVYGAQTSMDVARQDVEELLPVFSFLSSHGNKLYQEGYFLKLNDLDTNGRPNADRNWTECFAQLVGTVLSLWDATALDAAGQDGEVAPTFINLADASIKMIETLPTRNQDVQPLQNVLSVSTAGKNRYLLHFNSLHSLTQWTAGIRLAMFEHASLHELYTGSLIAGKGKHLNNIRTIMEKARFRTEDWARVRFGAGTPWRRCWCVIDPPDEKEFLKQQKSLKKKSPYDRPAHPRGNIKFYDTKKTKKALPIATITDAYSAYAIYPQSKPLIDQSTLVKVEGKITIHSKPESRTEGFVFVMPEVHPAVSGFEMMLRWLFPVYDVFRLYGRPERLIADTRATQGLMFAMPKEKRYGYLDIIDVAALIHSDGSEKWSEREWRKQLKDATRKRMDMVSQRTGSILGNRAGPSGSLNSRNGVRYGGDGASIRSQPSQRPQQNLSSDAVFETTTKPGPIPSGGKNLLPPHTHHARSVSESVTVGSPTKNNTQAEEMYAPSQPLNDQQQISPTELSASRPRRRDTYWNERQNDLENLDSQNSSESELGRLPRSKANDATAPAPVATPPSFTHQPGDRPHTKPNAMPELRREKSRMSTGTLSQLVDASRGSAPETAAAGANAAWKSQDSNFDQGPRGVNSTPFDRGLPANQDLRKGVVAEAQYTESPTLISAGGFNSTHSQVTQLRSSSAQSANRQPLPRTPSSHSINRKPVPGQTPPPVPTISMNDSTLGLATDASLLSVRSMQRQPSDHTSQYSQSMYDRDDDSGSDYHNTRKSDESKRSQGNPRTGVLKSVGNPEVGRPMPASATDIPVVDFGPTQSLNPNMSRPASSMDKTSHSVTPNDSKRNSYLGAANPSGSPNNDSKSNSYFGLANSTTGKSQSRSPSHPERAMAWQPGVGSLGGDQGSSLSPEEFVQQRAAAARTPHGAIPQRSRSEQIQSPEKPRDATRQYPRNVSPFVQQDYSSRLSAHEQEHVARMTGTPLVANLGDKKPSPDPSIGLIGAIEAREQERRNMKEGVSGQMVQHAIAQRHAQTQAQQAAQYAYNYSQQHRPTMSQEALSYSHPQQYNQQPQSQPYNQQIQPAHLAYNNYPQEQQQQGWSSNDVRQNRPYSTSQHQGQWNGPPQAHYGQQQRPAPGQNQGGGQYHQQTWSGYRA